MLFSLPCFTSSHVINHLFPANISKSTWRNNSRRRKRSKSLPKLWSKRRSLLSKRHINSTSWRTRGSWRRGTVSEQPNDKSQRLPWQLAVPNSSTPATTPLPKQQQQQQQRSIPRQGWWGRSIPRRCWRLSRWSVPCRSSPGELIYFRFKHSSFYLITVPTWWGAVRSQRRRTGPVLEVP